MSYSASDFAMEVENLCRLHGFKGGTLEELSTFLRERLPPKPQKVYAWMTEGIDPADNRWKTGFVAVGGLIPNHITPLIGRSEMLFRGLQNIAYEHGEKENQTTWFRTFTHYIDEEAIYVKKETVDEGQDQGEGQEQSKIKVVHVKNATEALDALKDFLGDPDEDPKEGS